MNKYDIFKLVDNTVLKVESTWADIKKLCDISIKNSTASVCIPPAFVKQTKDYVQDKIKICTVIGFPNGYNTTDVKVFETTDAINNGADEIDMVINIGWLKEKKYDDIEEEIKKVKTACGDKILKVIIETCILTEEEKINMCRIVTEAQADFIKTSTGFSKAGATLEDVILFKDNVGDAVKIKAAGGISDISMAEEFIKAGAHRLGTSRIVKE